jgi:predicted nucleotidyltransferase
VFTKLDLVPLAIKFKLRLIVILGSYGTESFQMGESDIDIAILAETSLTPRDYLEIVNNTSRLFGYSKIDLIDLSRASGLLKYELATKGRLLFERQIGEFERYRLYCLRYYYDTNKFRELRKKYFDDQLGVLLDG